MARDNNIAEKPLNTASIEKKTPFIATVETSGRLGSVAVAEGSVLLGKAFFSAPAKHSAEVFPALAQLLKAQNKAPKDIEQIYISIGPGSFTGLRIAATIAKMMSLANDTKIVAVDTLDILAENIYEYIEQTAHTPQSIAAILDAKRDEFFIAVYNFENGRYIKSTADSVLTAEEFVERFANPQNPIAIFGEGLVYYKEKFRSSGIDVLDEKYWNPLPQNLHLIGWKKAQACQFAEPMTLVPAYLKHLDTKIKSI